MFNLFKRKSKPNAYDLIDTNASGNANGDGELRATETIANTQRIGVYELTETDDAPTVVSEAAPGAAANRPNNDANAGVKATNGSAPAPIAALPTAAPGTPAPDTPDTPGAPTPTPTEPTDPHVPVTRVAATRPNANKTPVISIREMTKVYSMGDMEVRALNGVDLDILPGEMIAIMGPSGSGKSTLMNMLGCLDVPTGGTYLLDGTDVGKLNDNQLAEIRGRKLGFVFQSFNLLSRTTAIANVELPLIYAGGRPGQRRKRAAESLGLVGLGERLDHKPNELSGGQQQRVAIARALINRPKMILADEPTGNLDTRTSTEIMQLFQRLNKEQGITVIFVTHDPETADYCRRVIHIRDGVIERDERK